MKNFKSLKILFFFGLIFVVYSCSTKKVVNIDRQKLKELVKAQKDSISEVKNEIKTYEFFAEKNENLEIEIISDKEKDSVTYAHSVGGKPFETIVVKGGSLKLKKTQNTADKQTSIETKKQLSTQNRTNHITEKSVARTGKTIEKEVKKTPFWAWLIYGGFSFLILIILVMAWRIFKKL